MARQIIKKLGSVPTVIILSQVRSTHHSQSRVYDVLTVCVYQDSFYKYLNPEEQARAHANLHDFDHPDALDLPMFTAVNKLLPLSTSGLLIRFLELQCLADLKACRQSNIPVYSFEQHQRLPEKQYLYGATIIIGMIVTTVGCTFLPTPS